MSIEDCGIKNTDRELWRESPGDYYAHSIHVTEAGKIGMNVGGTVFVMPLEVWHQLAKKHCIPEPAPDKHFKRCPNCGLELTKELWDEIHGPKTS